MILYFGIVVVVYVVAISVVEGLEVSRTAAFFAGAIFIILAMVLSVVLH